MAMARQLQLAAAVDRDKGVEPMAVDGEAQPLPPLGPIDVVFMVLVHNAIEEFGYAPRDVYNGIFDLPGVKVRHDNQVRDLEYNDLVNLCETFTKRYLLDELSHHVVAVHPIEHTFRLDGWRIDFKSARIARAMVELMVELEHRHLRHTYQLLRNFGPGLAGTLFESIAHRVLAGNDTPQSIAMDSDGGTPPTFFARPFPAPPPHPVPLYVRTKPIVYIDLLGDLCGVASDNNNYYSPTSPTNPLFDSFTVILDPSKYAAVVSVYQMTTSQKHKGSADGYLLIRKIIARARGLLNCPPDQKAHISVNYILVCPDDGAEHRWTMPEGWDKDNSFNNQIGEGFCIRIPSHYLKGGPTAD